MFMFSRCPLPPHSGAVSSPKTFQTARPQLRDSVSGREIREGGLSLLSPALAIAPVDGPSCPCWAGLGLLSLETSGIVRSLRSVLAGAALRLPEGQQGGDAVTGGVVSKAAGDRDATRARTSPRRGGSHPGSKERGRASTPAPGGDESGLIRGYNAAIPVPWSDLA
jgi:hypothetical protein